MDRHPRACWFAAIPRAQKVKDVEDCVKNTAAPPLNKVWPMDLRLRSRHVLNLTNIYSNSTISS